MHVAYLTFRPATPYNEQWVIQKCCQVLCVTCWSILQSKRITNIIYQYFIRLFDASTSILSCIQQIITLLTLLIKSVHISVVNSLGLLSRILSVKVVNKEAQITQKLHYSTKINILGQIKTVVPYTLCFFRCQSMRRSRKVCWWGRS